MRHQAQTPIPLPRQLTPISSLHFSEVDDLQKENDQLRVSCNYYLAIAHNQNEDLGHYLDGKIDRIVEETERRLTATMSQSTAPPRVDRTPSAAPE